MKQHWQEILRPISYARVEVHVYCIIWRSITNTFTSWKWMKALLSTVSILQHSLFRFYKYVFSLRLYFYIPGLYVSHVFIVRKWKFNPYSNKLVYYIYIYCSFDIFTWIFPHHASVLYSPILYGLYCTLLVARA